MNKNCPKTCYSHHHAWLSMMLFWLYHTDIHTKQNVRCSVVYFFLLCLIFISQLNWIGCGGNINGGKTFWNVSWSHFLCHKKNLSCHLFTNPFADCPSDPTCLSSHRSIYSSISPCQVAVGPKTASYLSHHNVSNPPQLFFTEAWNWSQTFTFFSSSSPPPPPHGLLSSPPRPPSIKCNYTEGLSGLESFHKEDWNEHTVAIKSMIVLITMICKQGV